MKTKDAKGERGAALLTVLFVSVLLLAAGGALILVTSSASRTAIDSTAEMQAYYGAEAGLQSTMNVLRGNIAPNAVMPAGTQINFRNAVTLLTSNVPTDTSLTPRLSAWLNYNYTPTGLTNPDRVTLTAGYAPLTGLAYSVQVSDPDNTPVASGAPTRLLIRVTGYGPKGATKRLELFIKRTNLDYSPPALLMMRGANNGDPLNFTIGQSNAKDYSGHDRTSAGIVPTFGATSAGDMGIEAASDGKETVVAPKVATIGDSSLPTWLQTAQLARDFLAEQKLSALSQNRADGSCALSGPDPSPGCSYYTSFDGNANGFTFVDGNATLGGGSGLLIVTGTLTMNGNPNFNGLILVLGDGNVQRDGGGNGAIYGAMAVARFARNGNGPFLAPTFNTNGGGTSTMQYDSTAVRQALNVAGPRVLGVHEY
ncbi:MAG: hypothetical protein ACMG6H_01880 [Acidobacteriota bacterium]